MSQSSEKSAHEVIREAAARQQAALVAAGEFGQADLIRRALSVDCKQHRCGMLPPLVVGGQPRPPADTDA